jgi:hypothetical protein
VVFRKKIHGFCRDRGSVAAIAISTHLLIDISYSINPMHKRTTIALLGALSFTVHACSTSVEPPVTNNPPTASVAQTEPINRDIAPTTVTESESATENSATEEPTPDNLPESPSPALTVSQPALSNVVGSRQDRSWEDMGTASTGETVRLTFDSIQVTVRSLGLPKFPTYFFQYKIGQDHVYAVTGCDGTFSISTDGDHYDTPRRPESEATQKMLDRVCSAWVRSAEVFSPPSNVRMSPNGEIICTLQETQSITTYGYYDDWLYTSACGKLGLIHSSQIR